MKKMEPDLEGQKGINGQKGLLINIPFNLLKTQGNSTLLNYIE